MTGKDRQDNDLRHFVGMHGFECPYDLFCKAPPRLDDEQVLLVIAGLPFPAVQGPDRCDVDAGDKVLLKKTLCQIRLSGRGHRGINDTDLRRWSIFRIFLLHDDEVIAAG